MHEVGAGPEASHAATAEAERGLALVRAGRRQEAITVLEDLRQSDDDDPAALYATGRLARALADVDTAVGCFARAAGGNPQNAAYVYALGEALQAAGDRKHAQEAYRRALQIDPDMPDALNAMGLEMMHLGRYECACDYLQRAAATRPGDANSHTNLATASTESGRYDAAERAARVALQIDPGHAGARFILGRVLAETGRLPEAESELRETIRAEPAMGPAYELLTKIRTFSNDDREIADAATRALEQDMPPAYRYCLLFALAKMHADCGNYDAAFERYRQANELQAGSDDGSAISKAFARMREIFDRELLSRLPARGHRSRKPVFIVGMPRSGTTLMERIIAAHPEAAAAGELQHIARLAVDEFPADGEPVEPSDPRLTQKRLRELAADYLAVLEQGRSNASRIVDKMPNNVFYLGFVRALFPEATIIHARRHPLDVCISCYFQHFVHLGWSNDFSSIARLYSLYRGAIAHWKQVLPDGDIVDVRYEELVQDPAGEARRLVEACGLDWDDSILERATIGGAVRTASMGQVRQPVYTSSQQTWIRYAAHVEPLAQALAPYLEDDRDLLAEHGIRIGRRRGLLRRLLG